MQPCNFLQFECLVDPNCDWVLASSILSCNSSKSGRKWLHLPQVWVWNWLWLGSNWAILGSFDFVEHVLYMHHQSGQLHIVGCYNHIYNLETWIACKMLMSLQSHVDLERQVACKCRLRDRLLANATCRLRGKLLSKCCIWIETQVVCKCHMWIERDKMLEC